MNKLLLKFLPLKTQLFEMISIWKARAWATGINTKCLTALCEGDDSACFCFDGLNPNVFHAYLDVSKAPMSDGHVML